MAIGIYARVSSTSQDHASQLPDLTTYANAQSEPVRWYKDTATGKNMDRPDWERLMADVRCGLVTKIVCWRLDRCGRTSKGLVDLLDELQQLGCGFVSLREGFDISTPAGRMMYTVLASVAVYEIEVKRERQQAGIAAKRDPETGRCPWGGSVKGRRIKVTEEVAALVRQLHGEKKSIAAIARLTNLSRPTVYSILNLQPVVNGK